MSYPDITTTPALLTFDDTGIPDVTGLPHDDIVIDGALYMRRHWLHRTQQRSARIHEIRLSDAGRDLHDHPWDFTTLLLHGTYTETTIDGDTVHAAPALLHRTAETLHRLTLGHGAVWTFVNTGPVRRHWGFQTPTGWIHHAQYTPS